MNSGTGSNRASPFDRMLDESRSQFDALLRRPKPEAATRPGEPRQAATPTAPSAAADRASPISSSARASITARPQPSADQAATAEPLDIHATDIGRTLSSRFGDAWRYDVVDTRRDGEDVVVWGRLVIEDRGYDKTRRGRARVQRSGGTGVSGGDTPVSASVGGLDFVLRAPVAEPAEQAAYEEAVTIALSACARGL